MEHYFFIAGTVVRMIRKDQETLQNLEILKNFEVQPQPWDFEIECQIVQELPLPKGNCVYKAPGKRVYAWEEEQITYVGAVEHSMDRARSCVIRSGQKSRAFFKEKEFVQGIPIGSVLELLEAEHLAVVKGGFLLHASCVEYEGAAIVFTGPSGIGKSTQADLWKTHKNATIINGDRIMLLPTEQDCLAMGIPFCGSSGIRENKILPLATVIRLEQAPDIRIRNLSGLEAFRLIWGECTLQTWNRGEITGCMDAIERLVNQKKVFHLSCTPDIRAVEAVEVLLKK